MSGADRESIDLIAFFALSEEEARGLGLEESGALVQRPMVKDRPAEPLIVARPADPPALLDDTGRLDHDIGPERADEDAALLDAPAVEPPAQVSDAAPALPEHADDLPWPSEAEMLAAGPLPDPEFDVPAPPGVRDWVQVPVVPLLED